MRFPLFDEPVETRIVQQVNGVGHTRWVVEYRSSECPAGGPGVWNPGPCFAFRWGARRAARKIERKDAAARWETLR